MPSNRVRRLSLALAGTVLLAGYGLSNAQYPELLVSGHVGGGLGIDDEAPVPATVLDGRVEPGQLSAIAVSSDTVVLFPARNSEDIDALGNGVAYGATASLGVSRHLGVDLNFDGFSLAEESGDSKKTLTIPGQAFLPAAFPDTTVVLLSEVKSQTDVFAVTAGPRISFPLRSGRIVPYVSVAGGIYFSIVETEVDSPVAATAPTTILGTDAAARRVTVERVLLVDEDSRERFRTTDGGLNAGGGVNFFLTDRFFVGANVRYHFIFSDSDDFDETLGILNAVAVFGVRFH